MNEDEAKLALPLSRVQAFGVSLSYFVVFHEREETDNA